MKSILPFSRKHDLSFFPSGRIDISAHIARQLLLAPGDVIDIALHGGEWYLYIKLRAGSYVGRHEGRVWATANGKGTFRTCSQKLARAVIAAAGIATNCLRCPCGEAININNNTYITIILNCSL